MAKHYDKIVPVRLSQEEYKHLFYAAEQSSSKFSSGKINLSSYLRNLLMAKSGFAFAEIEKQNAALIYEINKIGVNLNQMAKKINSGLGTAKDLERLKNFEEELKKTINHYISVARNVCKNEVE